MKKFFVFWKTVTWTAFILVLFLIPSQNIPGSREIPYLDKAVHMVFFLIFTILFLRDMLKMKQLNHISPAYILGTFLLVLFLAIMIEFLQDKMGLGREGDIIDILYDLFGFLLGILLLVFTSGFRRRSL